MLRRAAVGAVALLLMSISGASAIFGNPETISPEGVEASEPEIATDERGNAVAVWTAGLEAAHEVQAAFRPAGGPWGAAQTLSAPGEDSTGPQVVFDERDNALVAWTSFEGAPSGNGGTARVRASFRPRGGAFGASQVVDEETGDVVFFQPRLAIDESATLVWTRNAAVEDTLTVQGAFRPKGGSFGAAQTVLTGGFDPDVAVDERGNTVVVATRETGPLDFHVWSSSKSRTGSFGEPQQLSAGNGDTPRVATSEDNDAIAVWSEDGVIQEAFRPAGRSFGPSVPLSDPALLAFDPAVAFDEEDAVIAWAAGDEAGSRIQTVTRAERGSLTAVQTLSAPGLDAFEPQVAGEDGAAIVWTRDLRVQGAFRGEHRKTFGAAQTLSERGFEAFEPNVAMDDEGNVLTVWTFDSAPDPEVVAPRIQFSFRPEEGSFTEPTPISDPARLAFEPRIATDEWGNAIAVWVEDDDNGTDRVRAAFRPAGLNLEFPRSWTLSQDGADASEPQVVFDERGNALVVWVRADPEGDGDSQVESAFRPRGGSFGAPTVVSSGKDGVAAFGVRVGIDESATAVWSELEGFTALRAQAAFRPKGGSFGAPVTLSSAGTEGFEPNVAIDEHGNSVAVWTEGDLFNGGTPVVKWAFKPRTKSFGAPAQLSPAGLGASGARVATDDHNNAVAVWLAGDGEPIVQTAFRREGKPFGATQTISQPGGDEPKVVFDERRNALAVWTQFVGDQGQIEAAFRPRYGQFGAPEVISPAEPGATDFGPEVAIDESAAVVWTRARTEDTEGSLRVLSAFRPKGGSFGSVETLSDRDRFGFEPSVAVDERGNAFAVWTEADAVEPNVPSLSLVQFAFRLRN
jgi:hypothetical protein